MSNYRLHYKKGDVEIQLESTDQKYVDETFQKLLLASGLSKAGTESPTQNSGGQSRGRMPSTFEAETADEESAIDAAAIVNAVHESNDFSKIEKNILHSRSVLARVLLAFHFAHKNGNGSITTGDVEKITDQLGVKVKTSNVSGCISGNRKYFSSSAVRQRGAIVRYKLNLQGQKALEAFVSGPTPL